MKRVMNLIVWLALATVAFRTPVAHASAGGSDLRPGESLKPGEFLRSANGQFQLTLQQDGNLVLNSIADSRLLFSSNTAGNAVSEAIMQTDGNFVIYGFPAALWSTNTGGYPASFITLQDDGNLVVYHPIFATGAVR
jgi:hypothetical protein